MISRTLEVIAQEAHDRVGQALLGTAGGSFVLGMSIETVNKYLQAGAFIVSMIAGLCAAVYYVVSVIRNRSK
jgi:hypothetical protein